MHKFKTVLLGGGLAISVTLSGCKTTSSNPDLPTGAAAYEIIPADVATPTSALIVPKDILTVRVFDEPDISADELRVDNAGFIQMPLVGEVKAAGLSARELTDVITSRLANRYLIDPQVAVSVKEAALRYVSVEGDVNKPGVYEIDNNATLLSAVARAESPSQTAKLDEIVVFRTVNGQRMVARFNLKDIRTGISPDPVILDGDVVMVGRSAAKSLWQDILRAAPFFNGFVLLGTR